MNSSNNKNKNNNNLPALDPDLLLHIVNHLFIPIKNIRTRLFDLQQQMECTPLPLPLPPPDQGYSHPLHDLRRPRKHLPLPLPLLPLQLLSGPHPQINSLPLPPQPASSKVISNQFKFLFQHWTRAIPNTLSYTTIQQVKPGEMRRLR